MVYSDHTRRFIEERKAEMIARGEGPGPSALQSPMGPLQRVVDPDPETVTRRRRDANRLFGLRVPPSQYELDFYARVGRTLPEA